MKILLLGANGQLGWELQRSLAPLGSLIALSSAGADDLCGDLADLEGVRRTVEVTRPDLIVNAAAYTAVDKAESEQERARLVNALAPGVIAEAAASVGAALVHYSTDYVFDGSGGQFRSENAATGPVNVYGNTKLEGEALIARSLDRHLILRTSWVYASRGGNFAKTMLRLAGERERFTVVDDQIGAPTGADLLADVTAHAARALLADSAKAGLYHVAAAGATSWHGYARFVVEAAGCLGASLRASADTVDPVPSAAFPTAARRPQNSRLDTSRFQATFGLALPPWQQGVERMLKEIL